MNRIIRTLIAFSYLVSATFAHADFLINPFIFGVPGNDSFTKILLHFDGTDASTTFTDSNAGGSANTWTANGNAQLDTGIPKFGSATGLFDGTGDWISTPDSADFTLGSGAFTVDFWFNVAGATGVNKRAFGQSNSTGTATTQSVFGGMANTNVMAGAANTGSTINQILGTTAITTSGWHHYAFVRTGDTLKLFIDGVQEGGDLAIVGALNDSTNTFSVGRRGEVTSSTWNGSIEEFRLSAGIARWTANFTPPAGPYN